MQKNLLLAIILLIGFIRPIHAQTTGDFTRNYTEQGSGFTRKVYMYVPTNYDNTKKYPLLFAWHGAGMPGYEMRTFIKYGSALIDAIIVCPDVNGFTNGNQIGQMIDSSYYWAQANYSIDSTKRIITGISKGGYYSFLIGLWNPTEYSGIIGINPAIWSSLMDATAWSNIKKIRMATILGTADMNYNVVHPLMVSIQNQGGDLLLTEPVGVTHTDPVYFFSTTFQNDYHTSYLYVINQSSGIEETAFQQMDLFPNPATEYVDLYFKNLDQNHLLVELFSIEGKLISNNNYEILKSSDHLRIQFNTIKTGIYLIKVIGSEGSSVKKLVIN